MAWMKALHFAFLLIWCAGLFYLPGLFAAHAHAGTVRKRHQMRIITRFTFIAVTSPAAVLAIVTGTVLASLTGVTANWLVAKLFVVTLMVLFHLYCGRRVVLLEKGHQLKRRKFHLSLLIVPVVLVPLVLWLALAKPDLLA